MNTNNIFITTDKKKYNSPNIEIIKLDNQISLILNSSYGVIDFGDPGQGRDADGAPYYSGDVPYE